MVSQPHCSLLTHSECRVVLRVGLQYPWLHCSRSSCLLSTARTVQINPQNLTKSTTEGRAAVIREACKMSCTHIVLYSDHVNEQFDRDSQFDRWRCIRTRHETCWTWQRANSAKTEVHDQTWGLVAHRRPDGNQTKLNKCCCASLLVQTHREWWRAHTKHCPTSTYCTTRFTSLHFEVLTGPKSKESRSRDCPYCIFVSSVSTVVIELLCDDKNQFF